MFEVADSDLKTFPFDHLDTTSISVSGENEQISVEDGEPATIHLTHGRSKDKRPGLKQAVMSLVANGPSHMPIWMDALDGNSSDKKSFHETIRKVREFQKRIKALMMVMTLCLLVYNLAQYRLRDKLKTTGETLPNQLDKEVQNPTMRWIFQIMEGLGIVRIKAGSGSDTPGPEREMVTNMTPLRNKIIRLFGPTACASTSTSSNWVKKVLAWWESNTTSESGQCRRMGRKTGSRRGYRCAKWPGIAFAFTQKVG